MSTLHFAHNCILSSVLHNHIRLAHNNSHCGRHRVVASSTVLAMSPAVEVVAKRRAQQGCGVGDVGGVGGVGDVGGGDEEPSKLAEEKVGTSSFSQNQQAAREEVGEVDEEEDLPREHWSLPLPGQPGVQLRDGCGEPLLADRGDDGDAQAMLKRTQKKAQEWFQSQASTWFCLQWLQQTS